MKALLVEIRREFWEHRALWMAPLAIALVLLLAAALFGHVRLEIHDRQPLPDFAGMAPLYPWVLVAWAVPFYLAAAILSASYLLDCLYAERRDRSILFWRSMPVSDARVVLVKLLVGLVIVPLGSDLLAALSGALASAILLLRNHALVLHGPGLLQRDTLAWLRMQGIMLYGLGASLLWYAPFAAWLMLISAWARRSPYAWAFIPPVLLVIIERLEFGTNHIARIVNGGFAELLHLAYRTDAPGGAGAGGLTAAPDSAEGMQASTELLRLTPLHLLASPRLWWGLLAAALMIAAAIQLRRVRDDA
jgi:ABC-2 type transport system permease protein